MNSHALEQGTQHVEIAGEPVPSSPQNPNALLARPSGILVGLPKLRFIAGDHGGNCKRTFFRIANELVEIGFANRRLILVVHEDSRIKRCTAGIAERQNEITVLR